MAYTMTMKAPVGPPICTRLPPKTETISPPIIAVIRPFSGLTPEAIAKAIARGNATIPTIMLAKISLLICCLLIPERRREKNYGVNSFCFILLIR